MYLNTLDTNYYNKEDFLHFTSLPESWWYYLDLRGQGKAVDFPSKMKPLLSWTTVQKIKENGMLKQAPVEKVNTLLQESMRSYKIVKLINYRMQGHFWPYVAACKLLFDGMQMSGSAFVEFVLTTLYFRHKEYPCYVK